MKKLLLWCAVFCGFAADAANIDISGEYEFNNPNLYDQLTCTGDTVITYTASEKVAYTRSGYWWQAPLLVNEGVTVTIDFTACDSSKPIYFAANLALNTGAKLRVRGTRRIQFGGYEATATLACFDAGDVAFVDDSGEAVALEEGEGFVFMTQATLWTLPDCRYSFADGAEICLAGVTAAEAGIFTPDANNEIVLDKMDLYIIDVTKIDSTATIRVKPGRKFTFKPCTRKYPFNWSGATGKNLANPIVLESDATARAKLNHRASKQCYFTGGVTGDGDFEYTSDNYGNPGGGFVGPADFTGKIRIYGNTNESTAKEPLEFYFAADCPGNVANEVKLEDSTLLAFAKPDKTEVPPSVTIGSLVGRTGRAYVGTLHSFAGQTISVGTVSGPIKLSGNGTVVVANAAADAVITVPPTVRTSFGALADGAKVVFARTNGSQTFNLGVGDAACVLTPAADVLAVTNACIGGKLDLNGDGGKVRVRGGAGFTGQLDSGATNWRNALTFWMDPTLERYEILDYTSTNANPYVEMMHDAREGQTYLLQNNYQRTATGGQGGNWHKSTTPFPSLQKTGYKVDGVDMPYLSCGKFDKGNRLYVGKEGVKPYSSTTMPSAFVVMVFGSQNAGGAAIVKSGDAGSNNPFGRCEDTETPTLDMPVFTNSAYTTWIDGVRVDPTQTGLLNGGWQVISFRTAGKEIAGFGYNKVNYQRAGGQNYGDIMVFSRELSDIERVNVEKELAKKWGIAYKGADAIPTARLDGEGAVSVDPEDEVCVAGLFRGTIDVAAGAKIMVADAAPPPSEADVAALADRVNWFDPDAEGALHLSTTAGHETEVGGVYDKIDGSAEGAWMMYGANFQSPVSSRCPWVNEGAREVGAPVRKWLDFSNRWFDQGEVFGNTLRYRPAPFSHPGNSDTSPNPSRNIRTGFVVFDSCRPGGNPVLDVIGGNGLIKNRSTSADPIWCDKTSAILTGGEQELNGVSVNGAKVAFGGKPEVFGFTTTDDLPFTCMGNHMNTQDDKTRGEVIGESLFFSTALSKGDRKLVENYLMAKWLGYTEGDYSDLRGATVTGAGAVSGARAKMPKFAADFTGAVTLTDGDALAFRYANAAVADALDFGGGAYAIPSGAKVTVDFATRPRSGDYVLIAAGTLVGDVPELVAVGEAGEGREMKLVIEDNKLILRLPHPGLILLVR